MAHFCVGISGASGVVLGQQVVGALLTLQHDAHVVITDDAYLTAAHEECELRKWVEETTKQFPMRFHLYKNRDFSAPIASGTYITAGMAVVPCSMATLGAVAHGIGDNLLRRAVDVTIKERRPLVLVPRELPLSAIHLENMLILARVGASIIPPQPAWYTKPRTIADVEQYLVGRVLDALGVRDLEGRPVDYPRWEM